MAALSFTIEHRTKSPFKVIYYHISHRSKQYRASLGLKVHESDWDSKKNYLKSTARNQHHITLRKKLTELQNWVNVEALIENPGITFEQLKARFAEKINRTKISCPDSPSNIVEALLMYAKRLESQKYTIQTINRFKRNANLLEMFLKEKGYSPSINSYTENQKKKLLDEFVEFLAYREIKNKFGEIEKKKYENSTVRKCLECLKTAVDYYELPLKINIKKIFPNKIFATTDGDALHFLTEEIMCLYHYDPKNQYLKEVLDMLVFCAFTGLRHGELKYVTKSSIQERRNVDGDVYYVIERYSNKERNTNYVPLNDIARELINKYKNKTDKEIIFPIKSNVFCNRELHKMMKKADEMFHKTYHRIRHSGTEMVSEEIPRWKALTFHAARHHYSYYLRNIGLGIDDAAVMLNHKDSATTSKYYKHDSIDKIVEETYNKMKVAGEPLLSS